MIDGVAEDSCKPFKIGKLQRWFILEQADLLLCVITGDCLCACRKVPTRARQETMRLRYDVANAGIPQVNGQYFLNGSSVDGSPRYSKLGDRAFTMLQFPSIETGPNDVIPEAWYLSNLGKQARMILLSSFFHVCTFHLCTCTGCLFRFLGAKGIAGDGDDLDYYRIASTNQVAVPLTGWQVCCSKLLTASSWR